MQISEGGRFTHYFEEIKKMKNRFSNNLTSKAFKKQFEGLKLKHWNKKSLAAHADYFEMIS